LNVAFPTPAQSVLELGPLTIHYYALCIITGIAVAIWLGGKRFQYKTVQGQSIVSEVAFVAVPSGIIGGRIYHVISSPNAHQMLTLELVEIRLMPSRFGKVA